MKTMKTKKRRSQRHELHTRSCCGTTFSLLRDHDVLDWHQSKQEVALKVRRCAYCREVETKINSPAFCSYFKEFNNAHVWRWEDIATQAQQKPLPPPYYPGRVYEVGEEVDLHELLAKRDPVNVRYDLLDSQFEELLARIADYGARKYGDRNWQLSPLTGDKDPLNHMRKHYNDFVSGKPYDHPEIGTDRSIHLAAIAFNAMMAFYWEVRKNNVTPNQQSSQSNSAGTEDKRGGIIGNNDPT